MMLGGADVQFYHRFLDGGLGDDVFGGPGHLGGDLLQHGGDLLHLGGDLLELGGGLLDLGGDLPHRLLGSGALHHRVGGAPGKAVPLLGGGGLHLLLGWHDGCKSGKSGKQQCLICQVS